MNLAEEGQLKLNVFRGRQPKETIEPGQILEPEAPSTLNREVQGGAQTGGWVNVYMRIRPQFPSTCHSRLPTSSLPCQETEDLFLQEIELE